MALLKTRPVYPSRQDDFDRVLDRWFRSPFQLQDFPTMDTTWAPNLDFSETDDEYVVMLDVPGIPKENLDVTLENNTLILTGFRESKKEKETDKFIWKERDEGRFVRTLRLPTEVEENAIEAKVHDGVLTVHVPKAKIAQKSKIVIK